MGADRYAAFLMPPRPCALQPMKKLGLASERNAAHWLICFLRQVSLNHRRHRQPRARRACALGLRSPGTWLGGGCRTPGGSCRCMAPSTAASRPWCWRSSAHRLPPRSWRGSAGCLPGCMWVGAQPPPSGLGRSEVGAACVTPASASYMLAGRTKEQRPARCSHMPNCRAARRSQTYEKYLLLRSGLQDASAAPAGSRAPASARCSRSSRRTVSLTQLQHRQALLPHIPSSPPQQAQRPTPAGTPALCIPVRRPAPGRRPQQRQQRGRALQRAAAGQLVARDLGARGHAAREPQDAQAGRAARVARLQRPRRAGRQRQHCAPCKRWGVRLWQAVAAPLWQAVAARH